MLHTGVCVKGLAINNEFLTTTASFGNVLQLACQRQNSGSYRPLMVPVDNEAASIKPSST